MAELFQLVGVFGMFLAGLDVVFGTNEKRGMRRVAIQFIGGAVLLGVGLLMEHYHIAV